MSQSSRRADISGEVHNMRNEDMRDSKRPDVEASVPPIEVPKPTLNKKKWSVGILADRETEGVPGSVLLISRSYESDSSLSLSSTPAGQSIFSASSGSSETAGTRTPPPDSELKKTKNGKIILEPQPHDSMNDPLNWSGLRRDTILLSLGFYCMMGGGMTTVLAAGFTDISETYNVSISDVALTTGLYMTGLGVGSVIMAPTATIFGKRPVYLITSLLFLLTSVWCALSPSYASLVVARVIQGIAVSPVECLPSNTIAEIFFLHERAYRLGIYTFLLLGGKNLVPLVSAAIILSLGWRWVFWIIAILLGVCHCLLFFFVPETFWDRSPTKYQGPNTNSLRNPQTIQPPSNSAPPIFNSSSQNSDEDDLSAGQATSASPNCGYDTTISQSNTSTAQVSLEEPIKYTQYYQTRQPKSFSETLKPYSGRLSNDNWFRIAARPFVLFAYPAILWSAAVYALSVGWLIVLSESVAAIFRDPASYDFDVIETGLIYISPFIGGILGTAVAGKASDYIVRYISYRNKGIYEPEFRLVMAIPVTLTTTIGLMGYGWSAQERDNFWIPTIFFGIISFGCTLGSTTAITFAVDSYRQYASEALVTLNFSKNIFHGLVFSLFFNTWLTDAGPRDVFLTLGGIQLFFLLFTIPMYIFGKRARMWTARKNFMEKL